ncbi:DUF4419 domain-containing protein [Mucilaginibacter sp. UR6-11]|uniref:DUF4419 domain-containing protein n=1 Tax=Mucilaginibacter sp. UR6-11 TaxID=1435644 RepID=UPI001E30FF12|nr:DUF4419 domain-containing protein [Mucilaginibacter sp. UR6-11]MCC8424194.1 DUF4419 domain-containing protein [Mucilaginibacter sp. UR6-11]
MKPVSFLVLLLFGSLSSTAQTSVVINVEKLKKPEKLLPVSAYDGILKELIRRDHHVWGYPPAKQAALDPKFNIIAKSNVNEDLVYYDFHPFFRGMYNAYASHRPFTLSPDMMWLLICQGFANHVNNNSESLRNMFVDFTGKTSLVVQTNNISLDNPNSPWEEIFPEFSKQISRYTGKELTEALTADFSTTTPTTKIASQITALYAMKSYFDFIVIMTGCGIPQVTLEGTPADWQKVLDKTEALRKYKLDWWVDKMEPVLKKIVKASKGKKDKEFWQTMFKYHTIKRYGASTIIDGWIVKFFPYDKAGNRLNLEALSSGVDLPDEIVKVNLKFLSADSKGNFVTTPLELWAGFMGLKQTDSDFNLRPEIGWMIRKQDTDVQDKKMTQLRERAADEHYGIDIRANAVPEELMEIGPINLLKIEFINNINIPDELAKVKIRRLNLKGVIADDGIKRIRKLFPDTELIINNNLIVQ